MRPDQRTCGRWDKSKCQDGIDRHLPILVRNEPITTRVKMKQRLGERRGICGMENMGKRCETGITMLAFLLLVMPRVFLNVEEIFETRNDGPGLFCVYTC
jgi:hypothetical protein